MSARIRPFTPRSRVEAVIVVTDLLTMLVFDALDSSRPPTGETELTKCLGNFRDGLARVSNRLSGFVALEGEGSK